MRIDIDAEGSEFTITGQPELSTQEVCKATYYDKEGQGIEGYFKLPPTEFALLTHHSNDEATKDLTPGNLAKQVVANILAEGIATNTEVVASKQTLRILIEYVCGSLTKVLIKAYNESIAHGHASNSPDPDPDPDLEAKGSSLAAGISEEAPSTITITSPDYYAVFENDKLKGTFTSTIPFVAHGNIGSEITDKMKSKKGIGLLTAIRFLLADPDGDNNTGYVLDKNNVPEHYSTFDYGLALYPLLEELSALTNIEQGRLEADPTAFETTYERINIGIAKPCQWYPTYCHHNLLKLWPSISSVYQRIDRLSENKTEDVQLVQKILSEQGQGELKQEGQEGQEEPKCNIVRKLFLEEITTFWQALKNFHGKDNNGWQGFFDELKETLKIQPNENSPLSRNFELIQNTLTERALNIDQALDQQPGKLSPEAVIRAVSVSEPSGSPSPELLKKMIAATNNTRVRSASAPGFDSSIQIPVFSRSASLNSAPTLANAIAEQALNGKTGSNDKTTNVTKYNNSGNSTRPSGGQVLTNILSGPVSFKAIEHGKAASQPKLLKPVASPPASPLRLTTPAQAQAPTPGRRRRATSENVPEGTLHRNNSELDLTSSTLTRGCSAFDLTSSDKASTPREEDEAFSTNLSLTLWEKSQVTQEAKKPNGTRDSHDKTPLDPAAQPKAHN